MASFLEMKKMGARRGCALRAKRRTSQEVAGLEGGVPVTTCPAGEPTIVPRAVRGLPFHIP